MASLQQAIDPWDILGTKESSSGPSLGDRLRRLLRFGLGFRGIRQQRQAQDESRLATQEREDEIRQIFRNQATFLSGAEQDASNLLDTNRGKVFVGLDRLIDEQAQGFQSREERVLGGFGEAQDASIGTLRDRLDQLMASIEGLGEQERADINQSAEERQAELRGELQRRGLGTSSLLAQAASVGDRERDRSLANLNERLQQQRLDVFGEALGGIASAQERFGFERANLTSSLTSDALSSNERLNEARIAFDDVFGQREQQIGSSFDQAELNRRSAFASFIERIQDQFPNNNFLLDYARQLGQAQAEPPEQPSTFDTFAPAAISAGASVATAKIFVGCIDANAMIATPDGDIPLHEIQVGDMILNDRDESKRVLFKDLGEPWDERKDHYVEVRAFGDESLVLTKDHVIGGKPAIDWEEDKGIRVRPHAAVTSGDLLLEDGSNYLANGFVVHSMLTAEDVPDEVVAQELGV